MPTGGGAVTSTSACARITPRDADGRWRRYVNERLRTDYAAVFAELDALVFLRAPSFEAVLRWRLEQEQKLAAAATGEAAGIMNESEVAAFIRYFERITRNNLEAVGSNRGRT
jgi:D-glycerate 3-kinase